MAQRRAIRRISPWLAGIVLASGTAITAMGQGPVPGGDDAVTDEIVLFERAGCPHCERASAWLDGLAARRPGLRVVRRDVVSSPGALEELEAAAAAEGVAPIAVPAILARGRVFVGWDDASTTGRAIEGWLGGEESAIAEGGTCAPTAEVECAEEERVRLPIVGEVSASELGLPLFTIAIGLVDGFNPCAMWVLLFLLSMLVHLQDRGRMALIAGTFVLVSALVYYAFMAAWLEAYLLIGLSRPLQIALGVVALAVSAMHVKEFFTPGRGPSLSIPASAKPGIYARVRAIVRAEDLGGAMVMVVALAVAVNFVELLCTAGLPALYTQVLAAHGLSRGARYAYLALYDVAYMADDAVMVAIGVVTLGRRKLQERGGRWLQLLGGVVIGVLGIVLIVAPEWLLWG